MAKPLLKIHCEEKPYCTYPVALKVAMDDGTIQTYIWTETKGNNKKNGKGVKNERG